MIKCLDLEFSVITDEHFLCGPNLQNVEELNLNGCREISDKSLVYISKSCKNLKRLEVYWNCRINDFCIKKIASASPELEIINLSGCKYLSDASITFLVQQCPKIRELNLTRLPKLTEKGLEAVA